MLPSVNVTSESKNQNKTKIQCNFLSVSEAGKGAMVTVAEVRAPASSVSVLKLKKRFLVTFLSVSASPKALE